MDLADRKRELRARLRSQILAMPTEARKSEEEAIAALVVDLPGFAAARVVLLYAGHFPEEIDTAPIARIAESMAKRLVYPRVGWKPPRLTLHEVGPGRGSLVPGARGIPEPSGDAPEVDPTEVEWVLVPGLGFDPWCRRIGRGAGHYDRLLPTLRPETPRWAVCLSAQWVDEIPEGPFDQPLDGVASADRRVSRR